jgi:hypothetical protein
MYNGNYGGFSPATTSSAGVDSGIYYTATPNGVDDTTNLQASINQALGNTLVFIKGTYIISSSLLLTGAVRIFLNAGVEIQVKTGQTSSVSIFKLSSSNITIEGSGFSSVLNGNRANVSAAMVGINCNSAPGSNNIVIKNLYMKSFKGIGGYGINLEDVSNVYISGVKIYDTEYIGIFIKALTQSIADINVTNCIVDRSNEGLSVQQGGIQIRGNTTTSIIRGANITDNEVYMPIGAVAGTGNGLCIETYGKVYNAEVSGNYCSGGSMGISFDRTYNSICTNNECYSHYFYGIEQASAGSNTVSNNIVDGQGLTQTGFSLSSISFTTSDIKLVGNDVNNVTTRGFAINGCTDIVVSSCTVNGVSATLYGVNIQSSTEVVVAACDLVGNTTASVAVMCDTSGHVTVVGNKIKNWSDTSGLKLFASTAYVLNNIVLCGNDCQGNNRGITNSLSGGATLGSQITIFGNQNVVNYLDYGAGTKLFAGTGSPEGVQTASIGSIFCRTNGGFTISGFIKESGTGNTGWTSITMKTGTATFSGTGAQTVFNIPHGLSSTPSHYLVGAGSAAAAGSFWYSADATNIIVTYITAPVSGASNVILKWEGKI